MEDEHGVNVSSRTVRSRLFSAGLCGCVAARKPLLRDPTVRMRWRSLAHTDTGRSNSGTMCYGPTKAPFSFSVGQSGLTYAEGLVRSTAHSALSPQSSTEGAP